MLSQTIDRLLPFLRLIDQPAFCIGADQTIVCNRHGQSLAPVSESELPQWLGSSAEAYEAWDRTAELTVPVTLNGQTFRALIQPLEDGTLFLLSPCERMLTVPSSLTVTAQVLRQPLTDLVSLTQSLAEDMEELEDPMFQSQTAAINRQLYRMARIACNLSDLEWLRDGTYVPQLEKLELLPFLQTFTTELIDICWETGRELTCSLPERPVILRTDEMLLERAILNLISNALKYSPSHTPIHFRVDTTASSVLFRVYNTCENADLLTAAFRRMEERGLLPDPSWGLGLGLPMTYYIARLLGGTVAVEVREETAVVTMSVSRKKQLSDVQVKNAPPFDYTGGMRHSLVELSDSLPDSCFDSMVL